jgi:hypothetical protein
MMIVMVVVMAMMIVVRLLSHPDHNLRIGRFTERSHAEQHTKGKDPAIHSSLHSNTPETHF